MFKNIHFPFDSRFPIKELASDVNTALTLLHGGRSCLRSAWELATQDRHPLSDRLVDGILHLRNLLQRAYGTPDGARWVRETLRDAAAPHHPDRAESSASDSSTTTRQRRREEPSSGRGNSKRATLSGTSNSDFHQHPRCAGRDRLDRRQVPPRIFHAAEHNDVDAPPFPPRISRRRERAQRLPTRVAEPCAENAPGVDSPSSIQHMVEAITAAAIAAVDRHLAHMGLYPRSKPASSQDFVNNTRPLVASASVATPPPPAGSVARTPYPAAASTDNAYPFVRVCINAPTAGGFCGPNHSPRHGSDEHCLPLCGPRVCSNAPTAGGFCGPNHSPRRGFDEQCLPLYDPRACISAPTPGGLCGPNRGPRPGPFEDCPPPVTSFAPFFKRPPGTGLHR